MELDPQGGITHVREHDFIRNRFLGIGKNSELQGWLVSQESRFSCYDHLAFEVFRTLVRSY